MSSWPPSEKEITKLAVAAANQLVNSNVNKLKVLVYMDDPSIMILDPCHFAPTDYITNTYKVKGKELELIVGRID